jgi:hypothetical protein
VSPQHLINVDVASRPPLKDLPVEQAAIAAAEKELGQTDACWCAIPAPRTCAA